MSGGKNGVAPPKPFLMMPRELLRSDAWRSAGINEIRFIIFLALEHMSKGGKENGKLKAPHRQLVGFGISSALVAKTIRRTEELGLVDPHRGGMRVATTYALTWLSLSDGSPPSNRWRSYRNQNLTLAPAPKKPKSARANGPDGDDRDHAKLRRKHSAGGLPRPRHLH